MSANSARPILKLPNKKSVSADMDDRYHRQRRLAIIGLVIPHTITMTIEAKDRSSYLSSAIQSEAPYPYFYLVYSTG